MSKKSAIEWAYNELTISTINDDKKSLENLFELSKIIVLRPNNEMFNLELTH